METVTLRVGISGTTGNGAQYDRMRLVRLTAEELGKTCWYGTSPQGFPTNGRGTTETLYRTNDGEYVVYVQHWSHYCGDQNRYRLVKATLEDLRPTGRFGQLAQMAGIAQPMALSEATNLQE